MKTAAHISSLTTEIFEDYDYWSSDTSDKRARAIFISKLCSNKAEPLLGKLVLPMLHTVTRGNLGLNTVEVNQIIQVLSTNDNWVKLTTTISDCYILAALLLTSVASASRKSLSELQGTIAVIKDWCGYESDVSPKFGHLSATTLLFGEAWSSLYASDVTSSFVENLALLRTTQPMRTEIEEGDKDLMNIALSDDILV